MPAKWLAAIQPLQSSTSPEPGLKQTIIVTQINNFETCTLKRDLIRPKNTRKYVNWFNKLCFTDILSDTESQFPSDTRVSLKKLQIFHTYQTEILSETHLTI